MPERSAPRSTARAPLMSRINSTAILELIRTEGPISRAELARRLSLSGATVTRLTGELLEAGLVVEEDEPGASQGGRRPILLSFNQRAAAVIGVDVGGTSTIAALADLAGRVLIRRTVPSQPAPGRSITPTGVIALVEEIVAQARGLSLPVRGVGIGAPSITRHAEGLVVLAPALGWENVPLAAQAEQALGIPTFVGNDVNLAALGEHTYGAGRGTRDMVAFLIGTGVGAGIILGGQLYYGARDAAGEIGYLLVGRESLAVTYPGFGHFESVAGGYGIAEQARRLLAREPAHARHPAWPADLARLDARQVFALAGQDPIATRVVQQAVDYLAIAVANLACLLNPERIVIGGGVANSNPELIDAVRERLRGRIPDLPDLVPAELGDDAVLTGAIVLARERTSGYAFVETIGTAGRD